MWVTASRCTPMPPRSSSIVSIDGEDAVIESVRDDVPGRFPFHARLDRLVPVES